MAASPHIHIGNQFGRWIVLQRSSERKSHVCKCECGTVRSVSNQSLREGRSVSCGCWAIEKSRAANTRHGNSSHHRKTSEYSTWGAMIGRCHNPNNPRFLDYGGRGIFVCEEWRASFDAFLAHVGQKPSPKHSIDRMNNEQGYRPGNVRWAIPSAQMANRRNTQFVDVDGDRTPVALIAKKAGIPANTLRWRLLKGWGLDLALSTPVRAKRKTAQP